MHQVKLYKKTYLIPQNWNEISYKTLSKIVVLLFSNQPFQLNLLCEYIPKSKLLKLPDEYLQPLVDLLDWTKTAQYYTTTPPPFIKKIGIEKPENITLFQLAWCQFHLKQLTKPETIEPALNEIMITLCHQKGTKYSDQQKEQNTKLKTKISDQHKLIIAIWFAGWYSTTIAGRYFPKSEPEEQETNQPDYGYFPLIYNLAKTGIYGNYEDTCKIPAHTVFFNLMIDKNG